MTKEAANSCVISNQVEIDPKSLLSLFNFIEGLKI